MRLLDMFLDIVFPPSRREKIVRTLRIEHFSIHPRTHSLDGTTITSLLSYKDINAQHLIRVLKYNGSPLAAALCARILQDFLIEEIAEMETFSNKQVMVVPVPLGAQRKRERGFNQTTLVLNTLKHIAPNVNIADDILVRTRETKPQTTLTRKERFQNVANAFALTERGKALSSNTTAIILVDDVTTTGATLEAASRPFRKRGIEVVPVAIAHG